MSEYKREPAVTLTGKVTKEPQLGKTKSGKTMFTTTVLANTEDGSEVWVKALAFDSFAGVLASTIRKGGTVRLTGQLKTKEYTKKDGSVGIDTSIFVSKAKFSNSGKTFTVDELTDIGELVSAGFVPQAQSSSESQEQPF